MAGRLIILLMIFGGVISGEAQEIMAFDRFLASSESRSAIWTGGLRELMVQDRNITAPTSAPAAIWIYRTKDSNNRVNWIDSFILVQWAANRVVYEGKSFSNSLREVVGRAIERELSKEGLREGRIQQDRIIGSLCDNITRFAHDPQYLSFGQFLSLIDTAFTFNIDNNANISFREAALSLRIDQSQGSRLKIGSLDYLGRNVPSYPFLSIQVSDWLRDCLYPPPPTIVKVPELSIYHSQTAPDRFYVDPNDLQDLMQQYEITQLTDVIRPEVKLSITPKSSDEFNPTFLPPHAIYRRTMALLAPPVQGARAFGNPLYNTTLEGLIYRPAYWKIDYNVRDELSLLDRSAFQDTVRREIQPDSLAFPGLYTFECRDTSYSVLDSEGERRGVMVVLPDLTTTHRLTSLDRAVSDLNFHHEIHLDSTYEIRTEEIPRFVQSDQISVEIEANSRELISVEIGMAGEEKPLFCRKIIVSSPLKAGENPIVVARRLEHVHPRRHLKIIENNPVAIAYFRYVSPEGQPLQPELGVKVDGKYWHEVYIHGWKPGDEAKPVMKKDVSWWVTAFLGLSGSLLMLASI